MTSDIDDILASLDLLDLDVDQNALEAEILDEEARLLSELDLDAALEEERATANLKATIAKNKAAADARKKKEEELKMQQYRLDEEEAEAAEKAMKDRIMQRKEELSIKKANEEEEIMNQYLEEERAAEDAIRAMKERIALRKQENSSAKKMSRRGNYEKISRRRTIIASRFTCHEGENRSHKTGIVRKKETGGGTTDDEIFGRGKIGGRSACGHESADRVSEGEKRGREEEERGVVETTVR